MTLSVVRSPSRYCVLSSIRSSTGVFAAASRASMLYCSAATVIDGTASELVSRLPSTPTVPSRYALGFRTTPAPARWSIVSSSFAGVVLRPEGLAGFPV